MRKIYALLTGIAICLGYFQATAQISDACKADFEKISTNSGSLLTSTFRALPWHPEQKKPAKICWQFGDGKDTCIQYPENFTGSYFVNHSYSQPGLYEVCVKITYQGGCEAKTCKQIRIGQEDQCKADFEKISVIHSEYPLAPTFRALPWHSNGKKPQRICWSFGDNKDTCIEYGADYTGTYTVKHSYHEPRRYAVCVKILYYGGCEATICKELNIGDFCKADFEKILPAGTNDSLYARFRALPWHSQEKKPTRICWTFGDGTDTCIQYPENFTGSYTVNHLFHQPGTYEVCVKILYAGGCEAKTCKEVRFEQIVQCKADFERIAISTTASPLYAAFRALYSSSNQKKPKKICWTFGDGKDTCIEYPENYTGTYIVYHHYQAGTYEVCVKIFYYGGCEAKNCKQILIVDNVQCKADFERIEISPTTSPLYAAFRALYSHSDQKKPRKICWTFGDGRDTCIEYPEYYTGQYVVAHNYQRPDSFEVCVKILYYGGCEASKCKRVKVGEAPDACYVQLFETSPSQTNLGRGFYVVPHSALNKRVERICWNFGDGSDTCVYATAANTASNFITHTYPAPGVYRTCVKVLFSGGCIATECKEVEIRSNVNANVCGGYMKDSLINPTTFKLSGYSIHNANDEALSYQWFFGDGSSTMGREVTHTYPQPGSYEVCLYIKTQKGCDTRICKKLVIAGNTQPTLQLSPNPVVNNLHAVFFSTRNEVVTIKIYNANGIAIRSYTRNAVIGSNVWDFEMATLLPGIYLFVVQSPNQVASGVFFKQ